MHICIYNIYIKIIYIYICVCNKNRYRIIFVKMEARYIAFLLHVLFLRIYARGIIYG